MSATQLPADQQDVPTAATREGPSQRWYLAGLLVLTLLYLATVVPQLGNDPIAGGDEGWIISASAKLAEEGVFGTDLFDGFYGAEDRYYFNLPLHHLVLTPVFLLAGTGLEQARAVSVVFGLLVLVLTYALGRRIGGPSVGLLAAALLVLLRLNLAPFSGLTLTDLGATVRYDLIAVPYGLAAVLVIAREPDSPRPLVVALAGLLVGLAALTQFVGAFFGLPLALFLLTTALPPLRRLVLVAVLTAAAALPFLPYFAFMAQDFEDFRGQARTVEQQTDLTSPAFYMEQLRDERHRYALATGLQDVPSAAGDLVAKPSARLALLVAGPLALLWTLRRAHREPLQRLLALCLVCMVVQLALFESTKRFVYWVVAVPFLCIAIAELASELWSRVSRTAASGASDPLSLRERARERGSTPVASTPLRLATQAAVVAVLAVFALEGLAVAAKDVRNASDAPSYQDLGRRIDEVVPEGAVVLGDNRMWPAMRDQRLRSLLMLFYHTNPRISRERTTDIAGALEHIDPDYLLLSPLSREILRGLSPRDAAEFQRFLDTRTERVATIEYPAYGPIEVLRVRP